MFSDAKGISSIHRGLGATRNGGLVLRRAKGGGVQMKGVFWTGQERQVPGK